MVKERNPEKEETGAKLTEFDETSRVERGSFTSETVANGQLLRKKYFNHILTLYIPSTHICVENTYRFRFYDLFLV